MLSRNTKLFGAAIAALSLAACGGGSSTDAPDAPTDSANAPAAQTETPAAASASDAAANVAMQTTPLNRDALFGLISETVMETGPCPFLSDETAIATADTNRELLRREVSNEVCRWSMNAGFSIRASVAPLASATPLRDRPYNIDTPPVIKDQPGPGAAAVILYDTAWDKEQPYAMGFEQGDKLVEIFVTGMETDEARLTKTAMEIADKLPNAPTIEHQYREILPAQDFCTIWPNDSLGSAIGVTAEDGLRNAAYGQAGCKWDSGYGATAISVTLARYKQGDTNLDRMIELGGEAMSGLGDRAVILTRGPSDGYAGDSTIWVEADDQQFSVILTGTIADHPAIAKDLMQNLFSRM